MHSSLFVDLSVLVLGKITQKLWINFMYSLKPCALEQKTISYLDSGPAGELIALAGFLA